MSSGIIPDNPLYTRASGTSMATPHVSGVVALMLEANPALSARDVIDILECSAADMPGYASFEVGTGMLDAQAAVKWAERGRTNCKPAEDSALTPSGDPVSISGTVLPGGYVVGTSLTTVDEQFWSYHEVDVTPGTAALSASISWDNPLENIYLFLYDPQGNEVSSSAGLLDVPISEREVMTTSPEAGTWKVGVVGRVNTVTPYTGEVQSYVDSSKGGRTG